MVLEPAATGYDTPQYRAGLIDRIGQLPADRWKDISIGSRPRPISFATMLNDTLLQGDSTVSRTDEAIRAEEVMAALAAPGTDGRRPATSDLVLWADGEVARSLITALRNARDAAAAHLEVQTGRRAGLKARFSGVPGVGEGTRPAARLQQARNRLEHQEALLEQAEALVRSQPRPTQVDLDEDGRLDDRWSVIDHGEEKVLNTTGESFSGQRWRPEAGVLARRIAELGGNPVVAFADPGDGRVPAWYAFSPDGSAPRAVMEPPALPPAGRSLDVALLGVTAPPGVKGFAGRPHPDGSVHVARVNDDGESAIADGTRPENHRALTRFLRSKGERTNGATLYLSGLPEHIAGQIAKDTGLRLYFSAEALTVSADGTVQVEPVPGTSTIRGWLMASPDGTVTASSRRTLLSPPAAGESALPAIEPGTRLEVFDRMGMPHQFHLHRVRSGLLVTDLANPHTDVLTAPADGRSRVTVDIGDSQLLRDVQQTALRTYPELQAFPFVPGPRIAYAPTFVSDGNQLPGDGLVWRLPARPARFDPNPKMEELRAETPGRDMSTVALFRQGDDRESTGSLQALLNGASPLGERGTWNLRTAQTQIHALVSDLGDQVISPDVRADLRDSLTRARSRPGQPFTDTELLALAAHGQNLSQSFSIVPDSMAEAREFDIPVPEEIRNDPDRMPVKGRPDVTSVKALELTLRERLLAHETATPEDLENLRQQQEDETDGYWNHTDAIVVDGEVWYVRARPEPVRDGSPVHHTSHIWPPVSPEGVERKHEDYRNMRSDRKSYTAGHELGHQMAGLVDAYPSHTDLEGPDPLRKPTIRIHARGSAAARGGPETRKPSGLAHPTALMNGRSAERLVRPLQPSSADLLAIVRAHKAGDPGRIEGMQQIRARYHAQVAPAVKAFTAESAQHVAGNPVSTELATAIRNLHQSWNAQAEFAAARYDEAIQRENSATFFSAERSTARAQANLLRQEADLARDEALKVGSQYGMQGMPAPGGGTLEIRSGGEYQLVFPSAPAVAPAPAGSVPRTVPARVDPARMDRLATALRRPVVVDTASLTPTRPGPAPVKPVAQFVRYRPDGVEPELFRMAPDLFLPHPGFVRTPGRLEFRYNDATVRVLQSGISVRFAGDPHPGRDEHRVVPHAELHYLMVAGLTNGPDDRAETEGRQLSPEQRQTLRTIMAHIHPDWRSSFYVNGYGTWTHLSSWLAGVTDGKAPAPTPLSTAKHVPPQPRTWPFGGSGASHRLPGPVEVAGPGSFALDGSPVPRVR